MRAGGPAGEVKPTLNIGKFRLKWRPTNCGNSRLRTSGAGTQPDGVAEKPLRKEDFRFDGLCPSLGGNARDYG